MPNPPPLSPEQRAAALEKAAAARTLRAELKEKLKMGSVTLPEVLAQAEGDDVVGKMKVLAVLESLPGVGKVQGPPHHGGDRHQRDPSGRGPRRAAARGAARTPEAASCRVLI